MTGDKATQRTVGSAAEPRTPAARPRGRLVRSFVCAAAGMAYLFRTQPNARIEATVALLVVATAIGVGVSAIQWCILILTIGAVLILEGLNTAIEALVDLASPSCHPLAKVAKDVAAAMVLMAAIGSVPIGLLILGPPLWRLVSGSVGL